MALAQGYAMARHLLALVKKYYVSIGKGKVL